MIQPTRKRYVFNLRSAMLLVLVFGLWMGWRVNRANDQRRAVALVQRAGGGVDYDHKGRPWAPAWLRALLGDEFFQEVTSVQFIERASLTDQDLAPLESFDRLEECAISGAPITDSGLKFLSRLTTPRIVSLWETRGVTDAGLAHLASLTKLRTLNLYKCDITDAGLVHLRSMIDLESLLLSHTKVIGPGLSHLEGMSKLKSLFTPTNGAGLTHIGHLSSLQELYAYDTESPTPCDGLSELAGLKNLRVLIMGSSHCLQAGLAQLTHHAGLTQLEIGGNEVNDAGLIHVAGIKGLQRLNITGSKITGSGLANLKELSSLTVLDLQDSEGVGDDGVEHLKKLGSLQTLGLVGTKVTDAGIKAIRQALPTIRIVH